MANRNSSARRVIRAEKRSCEMCYMCERGLKCKNPIVSMDTPDSDKRITVGKGNGIPGILFNMECEDDSLDYYDTHVFANCE